MKLRVWHVQNVPNQPVFYAVKSVEDAIELINRLAEADLRDVSVSDNGFGLEEYDSKYDDWSEYYDKEGNDVMVLIQETGHED